MRHLSLDVDLNYVKVICSKLNHGSIKGRNVKVKIKQTTDDSMRWGFLFVAGSVFIVDIRMCLFHFPWIDRAIRTMKTGLMALWCLMAMPSEAADGMVRLFAESRSKLSVKGTNSLHDWQVNGTEIQGWVEFPWDGSELKNGVAERESAGRCEVAIPVRSLKVDDGLTESMHHFVKAGEHPRITFKGQDMGLEVIKAGREARYRMQARGPLVIAGVTNVVTIPIEVSQVGKMRFRLTGVTQLKFSSHFPEPPALRLTSGVVRYRDEVEVSFEWVVGPEPEGAKR